MRFPSSLCVHGLRRRNFGREQRRVPWKIVPRGAVSVTSKAGGFAVWLPFYSHLANHVVTGHVVMDGTIMDGGGLIGYVIVSIDLPPNLVNTKNNMRFDKKRDRLLQKPGTKLQSVQNIQLGRFLGYELRVTQVSERFGVEVKRQRRYSTPKRLYQLTAWGPKADMQKQNAEITRVFDSFRILPQ